MFVINYATYIRTIEVRVESAVKEEAAATCQPSSRSAREYRRYSKTLKWIAEKSSG